ncbi:uncharacterized protein TNCV_584561 [Trichonephila clavipes]|nr:uncharacterized protein TNCV_584561 [Trichonephila clavipes]
MDMAKVFQFVVVFITFPGNQLLRGSPSLGEYGCPNPEVASDLFFPKGFTVFGLMQQIRRVYPLDPHPDAVVLYSGCTPATLGLLATDHVSVNHGQVTWTTPDLAPPLLTTTPRQREDVSAHDRFNVHRCSTRWVFSSTGLERMTFLP